MELEKISTGQHKARYMTIDGHRVRIDENLYDLIDGLNRLGIVTANCCGASCMGWCKRKHREYGKKIWYTNDVTGKREYYRHRRQPKLCRESFAVGFANVYMAERFMNVVYRESDPEKLRDHMQGHGRKQSHAWIWGHYLDDFNDTRAWYSSGRMIGEKVSPPKFAFWSIVVIPHAHLKLVTERVLERCRRRGV